MNGVQTTYYKNGRKLSISLRKEGKLVNETCLDEDGEKIDCYKFDWVDWIFIE